MLRLPASMTYLLPVLALFAGVYADTAPYDPVTPTNTGEFSQLIPLPIGDTSNDQGQPSNVGIWTYNSTNCQGPVNGSIADPVLGRQYVFGINNNDPKGAWKAMQSFSSISIRTTDNLNDLLLRTWFRTHTSDPSAVDTADGYAPDSSCNMLVFPDPPTGTSQRIWTSPIPEDLTCIGFDKTFQKQGFGPTCVMIEPAAPYDGHGANMPDYNIPTASVDVGTYSGVRHSLLPTGLGHFKRYYMVAVNMDRAGIG